MTSTFRQVAWHWRIASVRDEGEMWGWSIFPEGFTPADLLDLTRLQTWTVKPASAALSSRLRAEGRAALRPPAPLSF